MTGMLKKLLSPNIGVLYLNYVFRFCFLSFMLATVHLQFFNAESRYLVICLFFYKEKAIYFFFQSSAMYVEKCLLVSYTIGALIQFYILCYCIQQLLEAV